MPDNSVVKPLPNHRFSKHNGDTVKFPLTLEGQKALRQSDAVSPILADDPRVERVKLGPDFLQAPSHPGSAEFWDEFETVVDIQQLRRAGRPASDEFSPPKLFVGKSMEQAAAAVRADFPSDFPVQMAKQFLAEGVLFNDEILPHLSKDDFVNSVVALAEIIGWAVSVVSPSTFAAKWTFGRSRPESVAWDIHTGKLAAPESIKTKIAEMKLDSPESFTAYTTSPPDKGCPRHPAYPAMHSAASSASLYLPVVLRLSPEQRDEARRLDYAVAASRTLAGVHYESDNIAGLSMGHAIVAANLPGFLEVRFGAQAHKVEEEIKKHLYDWHEHDRLKSAKGQLRRVTRG